MTVAEPGPAPQTGRSLVLRTIQEAGDKFESSLPAHMKKQGIFMRVLGNAFENNPELFEVPPHVLRKEAMKGAVNGLLCDGRESALIVRPDRNSPTGKTVTWQPMVAGIRKLARNSGQIATWDVHAVYMNDDFEYELGSNAYVRHRPFLDGAPGALRCVYSVCYLKSGQQSIDIMSAEMCFHVRDNFSKAWQAFKAGKIKSTPWSTSTEEMCKKTLALRHAKVLPLSTDLLGVVYEGQDAGALAGKSAETIERLAPPRHMAAKLDHLAAQRPRQDQAEPVAEGSEPQKEAVPAEPPLKAQETPHDPVTGEVIEDAQAEPGSTELPPDQAARRAGEIARHAARMRTAVPGELSSELREAWLAGWDHADKEYPE